MMLRALDPPSNKFRAPTELRSHPTDESLKDTELLCAQFRNQLQSIENMPNLPATELALGGSVLRRRPDDADAATGCEVCKKDNEWNHAPRPHLDCPAKGEFQLRFANPREINFPFDDLPQHIQIQVSL